MASVRFIWMVVLKWKRLITERRRAGSGGRSRCKWDAMFVRLLDPRTGALLREHLGGKRGAHRIRDGDRPRRTPPQLLQLLARGHKAGASIGAVCDAIHAPPG